jgi:hypothetical protein
MQSSSKLIGLDKTGLALVLISSILLGVWAAMNTIALRNVLIWIGSLVALVYWWNWVKMNKANHTLPSLSWLYWLPIALIGLMFVWVVAHYFFFAQNPEQQFSELKSTWLRSFLAVIIGSATGVALNRNPRFMPWLWLGLLLSFVVLIYQYIPKAIANQSLFAVDWDGDYIYSAKFSGVLAGTILVAGLLGLLVDSIWQNKSKDKKIDTANHLLTNSTRNCSMNADQKITSYSNSKVIKTQLINGIVISAYIYTGICIAIYAFVFIFDAKAGVGMAFILIALWLGFWLLLIIKNAASAQDKKSRIKLLMKSLIMFFLGVTTLFWFAAKHIKNNPGWENLFEDVAISAQIDTHNYWKGSGGDLPLRKDGTAVAGNTYERVALGALGMRLIRLDLVGNGSLRSLRDDAKKIEPNYRNYQYTHSAWIDLGLSFGLPGLLFLPIALLALLLCTVINRRICARATIITLAMAVLILYFVGEYAFQHGVEILFYVAGLLCGLALVDYSKLGPCRA